MAINKILKRYLCASEYIMRIWAHAHWVIDAYINFSSNQKAATALQLHTDRSAMNVGYFH